MRTLQPVRSTVKAVKLAIAGVVPRVTQKPFGLLKEADVPTPSAVPVELVAEPATVVDIQVGTVMEAALVAATPTSVKRSLSTLAVPSHVSMRVRPAPVAGAAHCTQAETVRALRPVGSCGSGAVPSATPDASTAAPLATPR